MKLEKNFLIKEINSDTNCNLVEFKGDIIINRKDLRNLINNGISNNLNATLTLEIQEPILDEEERKYLSGVIRPFRDKIRKISKKSHLNGIEFIIIYIKDSSHLVFPDFKKGTMYKSMELNKEYTLEELEL